jgi:hypothetical protein
VSCSITAMPAAVMLTFLSIISPCRGTAEQARLTQTGMTSRCRMRLQASALPYKPISPLAHVMDDLEQCLKPGLAMAFKLTEPAQARWRAVNAPHLAALARAGAVVRGGALIERPERAAA